MVDGPVVLIVADDLIWADRLVRAVTAVGAIPRRVGGGPSFESALGEAGFAIVDLTARAYDGIATVERATAAGLRVLAVGQHDDHELRGRALAAGAERVLAYRKLFADGPATIAAFLARGTSVPARP